MSGGQAKNILLMELFANTCGMPVVLPYSHSLAVVLGAAMLGRFAYEASREKLSDEQIGEKLWNIMVRFGFLSRVLTDFTEEVFMINFAGRDDTPWHSNLTNSNCEGEKATRCQV